VKAPEVDVKAPKAKSKGFFARVKNNIAGAFDSDKDNDVKVKADVNAPDVKAPVSLDYNADANLGMAGENIVIPVSETDVNLKAPNVNLGGDVEIPTTDLDADMSWKSPNVDVDYDVRAPNVDVKAPNVDYDVRAPNVDVKAPNVDGDYAFKAPNVDYDVKVPNVDGDYNVKAPEVDVKAP
ncbi:unnamed protein product, partial [Owenia fusiformis]